MRINKILYYSQSNIQILSWQRNSWAWSIVKALANCSMECKENPWFNLCSSLQKSLRAVLFLEVKVLTHITAPLLAWEIQAYMAVPAPWLLFLQSSCFGEIRVHCLSMKEPFSKRFISCKVLKNIRWPCHSPFLVYALLLQLSFLIIGQKLQKLVLQGQVVHIINHAHVPWPRNINWP